jgi:ATP-binding cassette subfamily B protein
MEMPGGYEAKVAERGQNLSGGQRQRLALARLFLKNPPILILDEATSALDNISERHVQRALTETRRDRTTILVAHRLSTLLDTDRILVFQDGKVAEEGTYDALVLRNGVFAELLRCAEEGNRRNGHAAVNGNGQAANHRPAGNGVNSCEAEAAALPVVQPMPVPTPAPA